MKNDNLITVAIADDHAIVRRSIMQMIESFGEFRVIHDASNGKELIAHIESSGICPDICLVDVSMPVMNGFETARTLKAKWPQTKILALSMYEKEYTIIKMLSSGANGYLPKTDEPADLHNAMLSVYHKSYYFSELVCGRMIQAMNSRGIGIEFDISDKEMEFLSYCCSDLNYEDIAKKMFQGRRTVETYRDNLFAKLNVRTRPGLVVFALSIGLEPKY